MTPRAIVSHRPTLVGLAAFGALVIVTAGVMTYRLTVSEATFLAGPAKTRPSHETSQPGQVVPPTTAPPSAPPVSAPASAEPEVTIAGVGDVNMGTTSIALPPNDGAEFFENVASSLDADLTTGNFEGTLTNATGHVKCPPAATPQPQDAAEPECYAFRAPPNYAERLSDAGFDVMSLANNHTNDYGGQGLSNTRQSLRDAGVDYTGSRNRFPVREVDGVKIAVLGFGPYGWMQKVTDIPAARRLVERASVEADIVVVHMQAGAEGADHQHVQPGTEHFLGENRGDVVAFSHAVIDAGADLVLGHGPQVLRGAQWYNGKLIAYSLGNFAGYRTLSRDYPSNTGAVLSVNIRKDGTITYGRFIATKMVGLGLPALDPDGSAINQINELSSADFGAEAVRLSGDGSIELP